MASIDIFITSYKNPQFLVQCLESLQAQTFRDFNARIIDDCSPCDMRSLSSEIIDHDQRFSFEVNDKNLGGPATFMQRVRESSAKYVMWLHHDDWLHPTFLQKAYDALEEHPECGFSYSLCSRVISGVPRDEFPESIRPQLETGPYDISADTVLNCWVMWSCALIRREAYFNVGGLESLYSRHIRKSIDSIYRQGESDLYIFAKLSQYQKTYVINERLCYYRDHGNTNTNSTVLRATHIQDNIRTYDYVFDDIDFFSDEIRIISKINSIGRLSMGTSLSETAYQILYRSMLGRELRHCRKSILIRLRETMSRYIIDNQSTGWPKFFQPSEIDRLDQLIEMEEKTHEGISGKAG